MRRASDGAYDSPSLEYTDDTNAERSVDVTALDSGYIHYGLDSSLDHVDEQAGVSPAVDADGEMPDDALYEEDDDEYDDDLPDDLSSSPSIPDENINFDLVYALHTFVATVDGQATVQKGDHLMLLDDSNSYWWLVRVMASQEVGYIPAENIETPYERLARLNKHRNVEIATATDRDTGPEPDQAAAPSSYLVKSRHGSINEHSGKPSALSRRKEGVRMSDGTDGPRKRGVLFGTSEYVEHSGNELSEDDHEYEYDDEYEYSPDPHEAEEEDASASSAPVSSAPASHETALASPGGVSPPAAGSPSDTPASSFSRDDQPRGQRSSVLGMPGSAKLFSVVRLFAGESIESDATFKTVLLHASTTAAELVKQAMQRFHLSDDESDYAIMIHHVDGHEHTLDAHECPLALLDALAEQVGDSASDHSPKHDSVSSLASLVDSSSKNVTLDYSDDRYGKLFFVRRDPSFSDHGQVRDEDTNATGVLGTSAAVASTMASAAASVARALQPSSHSKGASAAPSLLLPTPTPAPNDALMRFTVQIALHAIELPTGYYFLPPHGLPTRGPPPPDTQPPSSQVRLLRFAKNATVAEVVEAALASFQVPDAMVDGGDDVESRAWHGRPRATYRLVAETEEGQQTLSPTSKVLAAYDVMPRLQSLPTESKRKSLDLAVTPGQIHEVASTDPLFLLRLVPQARRRDVSPPMHGTPRGWQPDLSSPSLASPMRVQAESFSPMASTRLDHAEGSSKSRMSESPRVRYSLLSSVPSARPPPNDDGLSAMPTAPPPDEDDSLERFLAQPSWPSESPSSSHDPVEARIRKMRLDATKESLSAQSTSTLPSLTTTAPSALDWQPSSLPSLSSPPRAPSQRTWASLSSPMSQGGYAGSPSRSARAPSPLAPAALSGPGSSGPGSSGPLSSGSVGLQRSSSTRSVSASDAPLEPRPSAQPRRMVDRVLSDTTVATGTDRRGKERYQFHALYGIVDALVIDRASRDEPLSSSAPPSSSSPGGLKKRGSFALSKLLDDTPAEAIDKASHGLLALPFPQRDLDHNDSLRPYAPLMSRISAIEAALDEQLRRAVHLR